jgi:hypothetical protein
MPVPPLETATYHVYWGASTTRQQESIIAAYVTSEDKIPGFVLLKDCEHRTVAMVASNLSPVIIREAA